MLDDAALGKNKLISVQYRTGKPWINGPANTYI